MTRVLPTQLLFLLLACSREAGAVLAQFCSTNPKGAGVSWGDLPSSCLPWGGVLNPACMHPTVAPLSFYASISTVGLGQGPQGGQGALQEDVLGQGAPGNPAVRPYAAWRAASSSSGSSTMTTT